MNVTKHIIKTVPDRVYYISDFINIEEEHQIISKIYTAPKPKWTQLSNRRLQNWGGIPHVKGMIPESIPEWLQKYVQKVTDLQIFDERSSPNHVLINEYLPGQGIMPHLDGPLFYPTVSTISCGSHTLLHFYPCLKDDENVGQNAKNSRKVYSLLLERRSLLILQQQMYTNYMHGIEAVIEDTIDKTVNNLDYCTGNFEMGKSYERSTRTSLTIRNVPKCSSFKLCSKT